MSDITANPSHTSPSLFAWLISAFCFAITLGLCLALLVGGKSLYQLIALKRLEESFSIADFQDTRDYINHILFVPKLLSIFSPAEASEVARENKYKQLASLLDCVDQVQHEQYSQAQASLRSLAKSVVFAIRAGETDQLLDLSSSAQLLSDAAALKKELAATQAERARLANWLSQLKQQYQDAAQHFAELLSLSAQSDAALNPYTEGVLKGLPRLNDLPDGLQSLQRLKQELVRLHGKVTIESDNAYEAFTKELASIRENVAIIMKTSSETRQNQLKTQLDEREQQRKFSRIVLSFKSSLLTTIESEVKNELDRRAFPILSLLY